MHMVTDAFGDTHSFDSGERAKFKIDDAGLLEVYQTDGQLVAVFADGKWASVILSG